VLQCPVYVYAIFGFRCRCVYIY